MKKQLQPFAITWYHPTEEYQEHSWEVLSTNDDFGYELVRATVWAASPAAAIEEVRSWYPRVLVSICVRSCARQNRVLETSRPASQGEAAFNSVLVAA